MRLAIKNTLVILIVYLLVLTALGFWLESQLRVTVSELMKDTAQMVGREVAGVLHEPVMEQLLAGIPEPRRLLRTTIETASERSDLIQAIDVIDQSGQVVASDNEQLIGSRFATPESVFQTQRSPRLFSSFAHPLSGGRHVLFVPMNVRGQLVGYLQLALSNRPIAHLFDRVYLGFSLLALGGLVVISGLGLLLHWELTRLSQRFTLTLDSAAKGQTSPHPPKFKNEFTPVHEAAHRLGSELLKARGMAELAKQELDTLAQILKVGVMLMDKDGRLEFINPTGRELLGCAETTPLEECWAPVHASLETPLRRLRTEGGTSTRLDLNPTSSPGPHRRLRFEIHALDPQNWRGGLILIRDRDSMDALDTDLRMAARFRGLSQLYMGAAHDLKAPLNAMVINLEMLRQTLAKPGDDPIATQQRQERYLQVLKDELNRLNRFLASLLNQAAPTRDRRQAVDLRQIIADQESLLAPQARHQRVELHTVVPDQPVVITTHPERLKQALLNVLVNALEAMPDGGRLDVGLESREGQACIAVRDTGPGIPNALLNSIFEMHFTTKGTGTGIGLYVSRTAVEQLGGNIEVHSELGRGTCFRVCLPLADRREPTGD